MSSLFGKSGNKRKRKVVEKAAAKKDYDKEHSNEVVQAKDEEGEVEKVAPVWSTFSDLGLNESLVKTCRAMGFRKPTPVQRTIIPFLLQKHQPSQHILALSATGSGKTAAFLLPILQNLSLDPYGIFCTVLTPTRELAKQIHQQVLALGASSIRATSVLVIGGVDRTHQSCALDRRPHVCVATPGRLAELLRGPQPPQLEKLRYMVLDEADRLLAAGSGFEKDVAEVLLHVRGDDGGPRRKRRTQCQTLLFSATLTRSLESLEEMAGAGLGRLPLKKFVIRQDGEQDGGDGLSKKNKKEQKSKKQKVDKDGESNGESGDRDDDSDDGASDGEQNSESEMEDVSSVPNIPKGLKQEYIFMPSRVRDAYLITVIRNLMANGGKRAYDGTSGWNSTRDLDVEDFDGDTDEAFKCRSAIIFVATCERAAMVSGILRELGVDNVALHSLLSQNRRLAALGKFQSQHVRILVATDVASRGLDVPSVDLVVNAELPRNATCYVHRVGRTARAGRRGRAISLVSEQDIALVHAAERISGRELEKCNDITDAMAIKLLGPVTKAARLAKMKLMDIGFDELVKKMKERKLRDRKERQRRERRLQKMAAAASKK